jgi:Leucine-rich repeat (LRR) protein
MKLSVILLLVASSVDAKKGGKLAPKRKREEKSPLATRNTMIRACHKIKKGTNEPSVTAMNSKKPCKCLTGWKKSKSKGQEGQAQCDRVQDKVTRNSKMVEVFETNAEMLQRVSGGDPVSKCLIVRGDDKIINCDGVGFDTKKAKKIIAPSDTRVMDWSNNHIKEVHYTWYEGLINLEKLSFRNNFLRELDAHTFRGSYNLRDIDLSYNQILKLDNSGLFKKNPNLRVIKINNNMISELKMKVISVLPLLEHFEAQNNRLLKITGGIMSKAVNLVYADFSNNHLEKIATKAFNQNIHLKELKINNNRIQTINKKLFSQQANLLTLDMSHNDINTMNKDSMRGLKSVKKIDASYNKLKALTENQFKGLKELVELNLDHNQLERVPASVFTNCDNLKFVFMRHNKITSLDASTFQFNPLLRIAFLSHNEMDNVEEDLLKDRPLKRVDLGNNRLHNVGNVLDGSQAELEHLYLYKNEMESANANLVASAPLMKHLDASENKLTDNKLQFVANLIDNSQDLQKVNLKDNMFVEPSLDDEFDGNNDLTRLRSAIENAESSL